jgi:hypothetical protein
MVPPGGPGNHYVRQVARLKSALYEVLTQEDVIAVAKRMLSKALAGDVAAARLIFGVRHRGAWPAPSTPG